MLILPIRDLIADEFARTDPKFPEQPKFLPAIRVLERHNTKMRERHYRQKGQWGFTLEQ